MEGKCIISSIKQSQLLNNKVINSDLHLNFVLKWSVLPFAGVCKIFEEHLKRSNPNSPSITYDISQLFDFIDSLQDLVCLW